MCEREKEEIERERAREREREKERERERTERERVICMVLSTWASKLKHTYRSNTSHTVAQQALFSMFVKSSHNTLNYAPQVSIPYVSRPMVLSTPPTCGNAGLCSTLIHTLQERSSVEKRLDAPHASLEELGLPPTNGLLLRLLDGRGQGVFLAFVALGGRSFRLRISALRRLIFR